MTKPEILEKQAMSLAELKSVLGKIKKRDTELSFRAAKTEEYVNQVVKLNNKQSNELLKKITDLDIPRLKDDQIIKIVDLVPGSLAELKIVLQGYTITISNENLNKIMDAIKEVTAVKSKDA
jgi:DNA-directed RNA polymerase subunit F